MRRHFLTALALALFWLSAISGSARADEKHPVSGRKIADVMGVGGAGWLVRPERSAEEKPDLAVSMLGLEPGMSVADIGAGVGYFSVKMARKVGPDGIVYATDIQPKMLDYLEAYAREHQVENIRPILSEPDDPKLPAGSLDLVLLVDVYHEFSHPSAMLQGIRRALKPDGRIVLLEYREEDPDLPIKEDHKMSVKTVRKELEFEGFQFHQLISSLPRQHLLIFKKKPQ